MDRYRDVKISIIVPVYNVECYLDQCVQSIVAQTHRNLEIILVDDGSPDKSGDICDTWAARDSRIKVIHKENGGLSDARNAGMDIASGEYIGFVDSDDYISPVMYEMLLNATRDTGINIAGCELSILALSTDASAEKRILSRDAYITEWLQGTNYISVCNKLYHRSVVERARFRQGYIYEDAFFHLNLFRDISSIVHINVPLYFYRTNQESITRASYNEKRIQIFECLDLLTEQTIEKVHHRYIRAYAGVEAFSLLSIMIRERNAPKKYSQHYRFYKQTLRKNVFLSLDSKK